MIRACEQIPGSPADQEDALENKDIILAVDNQAVDATNVKDFIKGGDQALHHALHPELTPRLENLNPAP